jgi:HEAT repeats
MTRLRILMPLASILVMGSISAAAQAPTGSQIKNAQLETRAVSGSLDSTVRGIAGSQTAPLWVGYTVPMLEARDGRWRSMCCGSWSSDYGNGNCNPCTIESSRGTNETESDRPVTGGGTVRLEGPQEMFVLLRLADHRIGRILSLTEDCQVDAGGMRMIWLTGVNAADSVTVLTGIALAPESDTRDGREPVDSAVRAIAMTKDASADRALSSFIALDKPESLRSKTAFWLGNSRGREGLDMLKRMAKSDTSPKVREQVTFALTQSREKDALDELIRMAKEDESSRVRGQALFWLAQKAGQRAAGAITEAIENDPDTDVKKKAVFALSQMPKSDGIPKLIEVARSNKNPAVRKQAMFWLGQSNDPRALAFFEEVLTH